MSRRRGIPMSTWTSRSTWEDRSMNVLSISGDQSQGPMWIFAQRCGDDRAISRHRRQTQVATSHAVDVVCLDDSRRARRTPVMSSGGMSSMEILSVLSTISEVLGISKELIACDGMGYYVPGIFRVKSGKGAGVHVCSATLSFYMRHAPNHV